MTVDDLSLEYRLDLEERLARYGLQGDMHVSGSLTVPPNSQLSLTRRTDDAGTHLTLRTDDLAQMKAWIGVPDAALDANVPSPPIPPCPVSRDKPSHHLTPDEWGALHNAGRAYVYGPSHLVEEHRPAIERLLAPFEVAVHIYLTLDVYGALIFDDGDQAVVLIASTINFHPGGHIVSRSNLTVSATAIQHVQP